MLYLICAFAVLYLLIKAFFSRVSLKEYEDCIKHGGVMSQLVLVFVILLCGLPALLVKAGMLTDGVPLLSSVLGLAVLVVHESGHFFFSFAGETVGILGGSLMQLLVPIIFVTCALFRRCPNIASLGLVFLSISLSDLSVYIADARAQKLPLVFSPESAMSGQKPIHDWNWILGKAGLLEYDCTIARGAVFLSAAALAASLLLVCISTTLSSRGR